MVDIVSSAKRSQMMAGIKAKNTKPEILVRKALHRKGFRYSLHSKKLPGKPDLVFPKYKAALFINGCFWHGHDCHLFKWPSSRPEFWQGKIKRNQEVDVFCRNALLANGWRVGVVWECAIKGKTRVPIDEIVHELSVWLKSDNSEIVIKG